MYLQYITQLTHVHEKVCRFNVVENGEEHGMQIAILNAVSASKVKLRPERVSIREDEDVGEDYDVKGGFGALVGGCYAPHDRSHAATVLRDRAWEIERAPFSSERAEVGKGGRRVVKCQHWTTALIQLNSTSN